MKRSLARLAVSILVATAAFACFAGAAVADEHHWVNLLGGNWSLGTNWDRGTPTTGDTLLFPVFGAGRIFTTNDLAAGTTFNGITLIGDWTITGNPLTLTGNLDIRNFESSRVLWEAPLTLAAPLAFTAETSARLTLNADVDTAGHLLTVDTGATPAVDGEVIVGGVISASGGVTKLGAGLFMPTGANTYTGNTTISGGKLMIGSPGTLPSGAGKGAVSVAAGATLDLAGDHQTVNDLSGDGAVTTGAAALTVESTNNTTFSGVISGTGSLTKTGAGSFTLSGPNLYTGNTSITQGVLKLGAAGAVPSSGLVTVAAGGTFDVYGHNQTLAGLTGAGTVDNTAAGACALTVSGASSSTFAGIIQNGGGALGLTKDGAGTFTLSGANTYSGSTLVKGGTLALGAAGAVPSGAGKGIVNVFAGATFDLNGHDQTINQLNGSGKVDNSAATECTLTDIGGSSFYGEIKNTGAPLSLTKSGGGGLYLYAASSYTGDTKATGVTGEGIDLLADDAIASSRSVTIDAGAGLWAESTRQTLTDLSGAGTVEGYGITVLTLRSVAGSTYSGTIQNAFAASGFRKTGAGTFTFAGSTCEWRHDLEVAEGTFLVASGSTVKDTVTVKDGAVLGGGGTATSATGEVGGTVWPGAGILLPTTLTVSGATTIADSLKVCVADLEPGFAADMLVADSATLGNADPAHPFTVHLVSEPYDPPGPAWDSSQSYRWHVVVADNPITQLGAPFVIDGSGFTPDLDGGFFSWETSAAGGKYYGDVVFTPLAQFDGGPSVGAGATVFAAGSTQAVTWETTFAPPPGAVFKLYAVDPGTSAKTLVGTEPATSTTSYSFPWILALPPSGPWHVRVELWSAASGGTLLREADSQAFDILPITHVITARVSGGHGSVRPAGAVSVEDGADQSFSFLPVTGYHVSEVRVDGVLQTPTPPAGYRFVDVTRGHTLSVRFAIDRYVITPVVAGGLAGHGAVTPAAPQTVDWGATPSFRFQPDHGYRVVGLTLDGVPVGFTHPLVYTFAPVTADHVLRVSFALVPPPQPQPQPQPLYLITPTVAGGMGSVSPPGPQSVSRGAAPTFVFAPLTGWHVQSVTVDGSPVTMTGVDRYTFPAVSAPHVLAVTFAPDMFTITASVAGGHGTISPSGAVSATFGSTPTFTFGPDAGYVVATILVDGAPVTMSAAGAYTFSAVAAGHTISASFVAGGAPPPGALTVAAPSSATVKKGGVAKLRFRVSQAVLHGTADVSITITDVSGAIVKTLKRSGITLNALHTAKVRCTLPRGRYTFTVSARTASGAASNSASNTLTVR